MQTYFFGERRVGMLVGARERAALRRLRGVSAAFGWGDSGGGQLIHGGTVEAANGTEAVA